MRNCCPQWHTGSNLTERQRLRGGVCVCVCVLRLDYENETLVWAMLSSTASGWSKIALQTENKGCKHKLRYSPEYTQTCLGLPFAACFV